MNFIHLLFIQYLNKYLHAQSVLSFGIHWIELVQENGAIHWIMGHMPKESDSSPSWQLPITLQLGLGLWNPFLSILEFYLTWSDRSWVDNYIYCEFVLKQPPHVPKAGISQYSSPSSSSQSSPSPPLTVVPEPWWEGGCYWCHLYGWALTVIDS